MFGDMMGKLQAMQQKTGEVKERLNTVHVDIEAEGIKVVANGNKKILSIEISAELMEAGDKEQIEELTLLAVNRVLEKAEKVFEAEMQGVAKGMLPGMM